VPERQVKSVSVEDTFAEDIEDPAQAESELLELVRRLGRRLRASERSGRTITLKLRRADFTLLARSDTLPAPTDDEHVIGEVALRLFREIDHRRGIRLLGVGVAGIADAVQGELFGEREARDSDAPAGAAASHGEQALAPGADVVHARWGPGWVERTEGEQLLVRFESEHTEPGPARLVDANDPALTRAPGV
jgi:DNA polymerase-4